MNKPPSSIGTLDEVRGKVIDFLTLYGFQIVGALIILAIGFFIAGWVGRIFKKWLTGKKVEPPVAMLAVRIVRLLIVGLALVLALDKCGVPVAPMIAGISVAGVGIGLASQGILSNLFAGLTIIFTKPFRFGEYIEVAGVQGQVTSIELFSTILLHPDRSAVVIPNRKIIGEIIHNYGHVRQLELTVAVAYGTNLTQALGVIQEILAKNSRVLKEPTPAVGIATLSESSIDIAIRPWTAVADYGPAQGEIYQAIAEQFRANNISIPFPQREVRMLTGAA